MTSKSVEKNTLIIPTENSAKRSPLKSHPHITEPQILVKDPQLPPLKSFLRRDTGHSQESEHLSFCVDSGDKQSDKAFVTEPFPAKSGPNYLDTFALRFQNMKRTLIDDASPHNLININAYENDFSDSLNANQSVGNRPLKTFSRLGSLGDDTNFLGIERTNAQNFSNGLTIAPNAISQNNTNNYFTLSPHGLSESKYLASKENSFAKVDTWGESKSFKNCALEFNQDPIPGFDCLENQNKNSQNLVKLQNL